MFAFGDECLLEWEAAQPLAHHADRLGWGESEWDKDDVNYTEFNLGELMELD